MFDTDKTRGAAGILTADEALARRYLELGATFVAVGTDVLLLSVLRQPWRNGSRSTPQNWIINQAEPR